MNMTIPSSLPPGMTTSATAEDELTQTITRACEQASFDGPDATFTGRVRIDPQFAGNEYINAGCGCVHFEPGARSAWHTHPRGQFLLLTQGVGRTQVWGGAMQELRPGDVVWCPPGVKHWHGAAPDSAMSHLAITGIENGKNVDWLEKVSDEQYAGG
ncbi:MAG TPA: cupin domain-containing protein [Xanthomonadaceae bacterium]